MTIQLPDMSNNWMPTVLYFDILFIGKLYGLLMSFFPLNFFPHYQKLVYIFNAKETLTPDNVIMDLTDNGIASHSYTGPYGLGG